MGRGPPTALWYDDRPVHRRPGMYSPLGSLAQLMTYSRLNNTGHQEPHARLPLVALSCYSPGDWLLDALRLSIKAHGVAREA